MNKQQLSEYTYNEFENLENTVNDLAKEIGELKFVVNNTKDISENNFENFQNKCVSINKEIIRTKNSLKALYELILDIYMEE